MWRCSCSCSKYGRRLSLVPSRGATGIGLETRRPGDTQRGSSLLRGCTPNRSMDMRTKKKARQADPLLRGVEDVY